MKMISLLLQCLISVIILIVPLVAGAQGPNARAFTPDACRSLKDSLRPGDVIFIQIDNVIYRKLVEEITSSWASHVGIAFKNEFGEWIVSESTTMRAKETELCKYLKRSKAGRFEVRRLRERLTEVQVKRLYASAQSRMGLWYDTGFDYDEQGTSFCSKFVYDVFQEGLGINVGKIETFQQLRDRKLKEDPNYDYSFIYLWFLRLKIPWERRTVTPESQRVDSDLVTVGKSF